MTNERRSMIRYLAKGGAVTRDELGPHAYWTRADRAGRRWGAKAGDRLLAHGCVHRGVALSLVKAAGSRSTYTLVARGP